MALVDFEEIPSSKGGQPGQDSWVLFAREYLSAIGLTIESGPDRGPDSGRDLLVIEKRRGIIGTDASRWLVSCKHFAHNNRSVSISEEKDIKGRVDKFGAKGFIAFYSTVPSSELARTFSMLENSLPTVCYDSELIERSLLHNPQLDQVFQRFFPTSYSKRVSSKPVVETKLTITCQICGKDLIKDRAGVVEFGYNNEEVTRIEDIGWACQGCDHILVEQFRTRGLGGGWECIQDLSIPLVYMHWVIAMMNSLRLGSLTFSDTAFQKYTEFTFAMSQLIVRNTTPSEFERIEDLRGIPDYLGGLGGWGTRFSHCSQVDD